MADNAGIQRGGAHLRRGHTASDGTLLDVLHAPLLLRSQTSNIGSIPHVWGTSAHRLQQPDTLKRGGTVPQSQAYITRNHSRPLIHPSLPSHRSNSQCPLSLKPRFSTQLPGPISSQRIMRPGRFTRCRFHTVVRFAITNAGWYYDHPGNDVGQLSPDLLTESLRKTLDAYPQWAGQLEWLPSEGQRQGRACITYGSPNDPGVELILARCSASLPSLVPDTKTRLRSGVWCAEGFPSTQLLVPTQLALHYNPWSYAGRPSVCVQITTFACGGVGIAIRIAHCLSDASTLIQFATHWGSVHRALVDDQPLPVLAPVFNPALIDRAASGDIHSEIPDPDAIRASRSLPILKHDLRALEPASSLSKIRQGTGPPTHVGHSMVYLSPAEVQRIFDDLAAQAPAHARMSRFDTMLAFIWRLIVRARDMDDAAGPAHMVVTVGLRSRLAPSLPAGFLGSPIILSLVSLPVREVRASAACGAAAIRATVAQFTPATVGAFMHDVAHRADPQRYRRAFLRRPGAVFTCWRSLDVYALDFGTGARPPYVDAVMPTMGGKQHSVVTSWQDLDVYGSGLGEMSRRGTWTPSSRTWMVASTLWPLDRTRGTGVGRLGLRPCAIGMTRRSACRCISPRTSWRGFCKILS
ncbi:transferase family-domain-containing protein [Trametes gibbosa]|nr:transferase family-domain-containing protein [Trametes gibbosa]